MIATCRASRDERSRPLPGDVLVPEPMASITNAITVNVPPARVWPWLAQLGSHRGGWYAYDFIDNGGRPSAERILPELQQVSAGDVMPSLPGATDSFIVDAVTPLRDLVLTTPGPARDKPASWEYWLEPLDGRTRLIARGRIANHWLANADTPGPAPHRRRPIEQVYRIMARLPRWLLLPVARFGHRLMVARQLRGIKRHAEALVPG
jgi:hypothetical protein